MTGEQLLSRILSVFLALSGSDARVHVGSGWREHRRLVEASIEISIIHPLGRWRFDRIISPSLVLTSRLSATKRRIIALLWFVTLGT